MSRRRLASGGCGEGAARLLVVVVAMVVELPLVVVAMLLVVAMLVAVAVLVVDVVLELVVVVVLVVAAGTVTCWVVAAAAEPCQYAVCPVNTVAVEQPSASVAVSVTV